MKRFFLFLTLLFLLFTVYCALFTPVWAASEYDLATSTSVADTDYVRVLMYNGGDWYSAKITAANFFGSVGSFLDSITFDNAADNTKKARIDASGMTASKTAALKPICTVDCTISTPSIGAATATLVTTDATQTLTNKAIVPAEVDGKTTSTDLTAAQVSNTVITNYDQAASDVFLILPTAAAGYSFLATVATAQSNHWCVEAQATDKIYLIAAAGTISAGTDGDAVCMMAAQVGQQFACWTFKTGASAYDWACKAIAIGTSTFEAHASSE